ncbi:MULTISPECIES: DUF305 domain-containing protein [unclassified Yoonia]|uniref:DUF305 domain-containing protein n=1 Tax=unclassified Yoonia TaxID=2629118 RepID=UPI002AFFC56D|nr:MULTISPECIES: DUF305 domain-containing protein [unclassified Yoonia]
MNNAKTLFATAVAATTFAFAASAQEPAFQLPEQCKTAPAMGGMDHGAMGHGAMHGNASGGMMGMMGMGDADLESMPEHVQENMRRMMISMPAMHDGMMNEDADVAFACGMIAHHQGAIDMAQVLIAHGEDPQMLALAHAIIAAQVAEMEEMSNWLAENAN